MLQDGDIPTRLDAAGKALVRGKPRETREFDGRAFLLETALTGDIAILRAWKVDKAGNCVFRYVRPPGTRTKVPLPTAADIQPRPLVP